MKTIVAVLFFNLFSHSVFADSHGSILMANAQMQAVSNYALEEASDLYRVLSIKRVKNCSTSATFLIALGGMNSETGKESIQYKLSVIAVSTIDENGAIKTDISPGTHCQK